MELQAGDRLGRYTIASLLGRGGMGSVYRARDTELSRDVAVKVISEAANEAALARFRREARTACAFSHPNVATVFDVGTSEGRPFLVMELVEGQALRAYVGDPDVDLERKRAWLLQIARALAAAHRAGLVHRDVKPDNVLVAATGEAKLVDFGIARLTERIDASAPTMELDPAVLTATGAMIGSPAYMPPEQLRGQEVDGRSDQFSWGVMAHELLTGRRPWAASTSAFELAVSIISGPAPDLSDLDTVAPALAPIIARCLEREAQARFPSMQAVIDAIEGKIPTTLTSAPSPGAVAALSAPGNASASSGSRVARSVWMAGGVVFLGLGGAAFFLLGRRGPVAPADPTASAAPAAAPSSSIVSKEEPPAPAVRLCAEQKGCNKDNKGWCSPTGVRLTCCVDGLVGTARGRCECPPGGSTFAAIVANGCKKASESDGPAIQGTVRANFGMMKQCYEVALAANPSLQGRIALGFLIAPDGTPYDVELRGVSIPDARFQDCLVDAFSGLKFPPPGDGHRSVEYPLLFSPGDDEDPPKKKK